HAGFGQLREDVFELRFFGGHALYADPGLDQRLDDVFEGASAGLLLQPNAEHSEWTLAIGRLGRLDWVHWVDWGDCIDRLDGEHDLASSPLRIPHREYGGERLVPQCRQRPL